MVADHAIAAGATIRQGCEAIAPVLDGGLVRGAVVKDKATDTTEEVRARYVVVADGANSRFGRALGATRNRRFLRAWPSAATTRARCTPNRGSSPPSTCAIATATRCPGYGWIFPVGDGTINVGIGLLSTFRDWKNVNTSHLMNEFAATAPAYWGISPDGSTGPPTGGRLPMGGSVTPNVGPTWVLVGDAAGTINPFNGEGIDYAYETGRLAAELLHDALTTGDGMALQRYPRLLEEEYGLYFKVARLFAKVIGNPALLGQLTKVGMQSRSLMEWVLRIMANLLREDELGPAEAAYKAIAAIVRVVPEPGAA